MNDLNRTLDHDHFELDAVLRSTFAALAEGAVDQAFECLDVFWARLAVHIRAENLHLFPALLRAAERAPQRVDAPQQAEIVNTIAELRADHDFFMRELTAAIKELLVLRQKVRLIPSVAVVTEVRERLERVNSHLNAHNALEETRAYRWACRLLDQTETESLAKNIQQELKNLPARLKNQPSYGVRE